MVVRRRGKSREALITGVTLGSVYGVSLAGRYEEGMKYLYAILSWGIVALGVLHMLATFRFFHMVNTGALWFFSGGIALVLTGILNLLHRIYGRIAPAVRRVCMAQTFS